MDSERSSSRLSSTSRGFSFSTLAIWDTAQQQWEQASLHLLPSRCHSWTTWHESSETCQLLGNAAAAFLPTTWCSTTSWDTRSRPAVLLSCQPHGHHVSPLPSHHSIQHHPNTLSKHSYVFIMSGGSHSSRSSWGQFLGSTSTCSTSDLHHVHGKFGGAEWLKVV